MTRPPATIEVLLATFNGERFLREQIDSILAQDHPALRILARDDGSTDSTSSILTEYASSHPSRFAVLPGVHPTGSAKGNFLALMQAALAQPSPAPYIAFADQDDVWLPAKLSACMAAMSSLEERHGPAKPLLVFTDLRVVDERLHPLHPSMWSHLGIDPAAVHTLARLLGRSVVTGCTMLIDRPMLALAACMPAEATMHDRWIGLLAASLGASAFLREPTVLYRQHDRNAVGAAAPGTSPADLAVRATDNRGRRAERIHSERQAEALLRLHGPAMPSATAELIEQYLRSGRSRTALARLALTLRHGFFPAGPLRTLALLVDLARAPSERDGQP